jgi:NitT/TauT family transport system ATP-binding protein
MDHKIVLNVEGVSQWFGKQRVLHDINLQIIQGEFVALVGPSGCGKTTLFNAILGTCPPKQGIIETNGIQVVGPNRNVGVVYQRYGLYRFLTAEENVAFGPMLDQSTQFQRMFMPWRWWPMRKKHLEDARKLLTRVKLEHAVNNYPCEMSGGMQQRVAICQSLIMKPHILLLDEPFGALDESTRESLQKMLLHLYADNIEAKQRGEDPPWTVLFITHELNEAFYVSDRVVGLSRNWYEDLKEKRIFGKDQGSTKVWDKHSPTYTPDAPKDFELFYESKQKLRDAVLDDKAPTVLRNQHVSFWDDLKMGVGSGVAMQAYGKKPTPQLSVN